MAKPSWIRAEDGDLYRASEIVAIKTVPHPEGGFAVTLETHRHDNIDVTTHLEDVDAAGRCRDALAHLLAHVEKGEVISYSTGGFRTDSID
jgi:hypothetical protein